MEADRVVLGGRVVIPSVATPKIDEGSRLLALWLVKIYFPEYLRDFNILV